MLCCGTATLRAQWHEIGNGIDGESVNQFAYQAPWLFAMADNDQLYRSFDMGKHWSACTYSCDFSRFTTMVVSDSTVLVYTDRVCISRDNGEHWSVGDSLGNILKFIMTKGNSVYAVKANYGLISSTDGGITWRYPNNNGLSPSVLLSLTKVRNTLYGMTYNGLVQSDDDGDSWSFLSVPAIDSISSINLFSSGDTLYTYSYQGRALYSVDGAQSWVPLTLPHSDTRLTLSNGRWFVLGTDSPVDSLWLAPVGSTQWVARATPRLGYRSAPYAVVEDSLLLSANIGVYCTQDRGQTWSARKTGLRSPVTCLCRDGDALYVGTFEGGVYRQKTPSDPWQSLMTDSTVAQNISCMEAFGDSIIVGSNIPGLYESYNGGGNWAVRTTGVKPIDTNTIRILARNSPAMYCTASYYYGVFRSSDDAEHWTDPQGNEAPQALMVDVSLQSDSVVAASGFSVFLSREKETTWTTVFHGDPSTNAFSSACLSSGMLLVGDYRTGMMRSSDFGSSWHQINTGLVDSCIAFVRTSGSNVIAWSCGDFVQSVGSADSSHRMDVYYSVDNGSYWKRLGSDLPQGLQCAGYVYGHSVYCSLWDGRLFTLDLNDIDLDVPSENTALTPLTLQPIAVQSILPLNDSRSFSGKEDVRMFDALGRLVASWPASTVQSSRRIDLSAFHAGIYMLRQANQCLTLLKY